MGCSLPFSAAPMIDKKLANGNTDSLTHRIILETKGTPSVMVPVLSKTIVSTWKILNY
jgi:hypothetical protein